MRQRRGQSSDPSAGAGGVRDDARGRRFGNGSTAVPLDPVDPAPGRPAGAPPAAAPRSPASPRPRIAGPLEAFLAHPFLTLFPVILLTAAAVAIGLERDPVWTSKARITVGTTDANPFLLEEVVAGNAALAASYSRAIGAAPVISEAAREAGIPADDVADDLSASPVPGSTLIQVEADGLSERNAVGLANAGAESLIGYVRSINETNEAEELLRRYNKAQGEARRAEQKTQRILRSSRRNSRAATRARTEQDLAALKASDLANRYRAASASASAASRLALIAPAASADSDRRDVLEQLILVGVVGGLVLGFALALLRTNWRVLRALRRT